jgi:hypothetical protein
MGQPQQLRELTSNAYCLCAFHSGADAAVNGIVPVLQSSLTEVHSQTIGGRPRSIRRYVRDTQPIPVYVAELQSSRTLVCSSGTTTFPSLSVARQQNVIRHEIGHALGYISHSPNSSHLMGTGLSNTSVMQPTVHDRDQINQFRRAFG